MKNIKLFEQYLNDNFTDWFGDSKVVDESNNPLKVFHGTMNDIESFSDEMRGTRTKHKKSDVGYHFTNDPSYADAYASTSTMKSYFVYIDMFPDEEEKVRHLIKNSTIIPVYLRIENPYHIPNAKIDETLINRAKELGHDGIIGKLGKTTREYVVFEPNQIKSATGNNGDFDNNTNNINESFL